MPKVVWWQPPSGDPFGPFCPPPLPEVSKHSWPTRRSQGQINRITILVDKWSGHPKGFAYVEFAEEQSVQNSLLLDGSLFRGRQLKVVL